MNEFIQEKVEYILEAIVAFKIGQINEFQQSLAIKSALKESYTRGVQDSIQTLKDNYGSDGKPALVIIESFDGFNEQRPALEETLDNLNNLIK